MTKLRTLALGCLLVLGLSACSTSSEGGDAPVSPPNDSQQAAGYTPGHHGVFYQPLPDGYQLLCVYARDARSGGPSCYWEDSTKWLAERAS